MIRWPLPSRWLRPGQSEWGQSPRPSIQHLVAFRDVRPGEDFLEFREAVDATAVLRRAGAFTGEARRVRLAVPGDRAGLDDKLVLPAVAEVVFVADPGPDPGHVGEARLCLVRVSEFLFR